MRSFNSNFIVEKNKRSDGPAPINLLTFNFSTPVYISDRDITPSGGPAHSGLVKTWGFIDSAVSKTPGAGVLGSIDVSDLRLDIINSEASRFSDNFTSVDPPENVTVALYQWFDGLLYSEKELIFFGIISDRIKHTETICTLTVNSIWEKYNQMIAGEVISAEVFPSADPDDIGKSQNIAYGQLVNVPCRAIKSGAVDSILDDITNGQTTIELSSDDEFPSSGVVQIDDEKILYTGKSAETLTGCTRGYDSTTALQHTAGVACWEITDFFVYQIAKHPVHSIANMYVDGFRITPVATGYTGQTGSELAGYEGQAVFTVPARLTREQAIDLGVTDTIDVDDGITVADTIAVNDTIDVVDGITVSDNIAITSPGATKEIYPSGSSGSATNPANAYDGNEDSYATVYDASFARTGTWSFPTTSYGVIVEQFLWIRMDAYNSVTIGVTGMTPVVLSSGAVTGWYRYRTTSTDWAAAISVSVAGGDSAAVYEIKKIVTYTAASSKTGSASRAGAATKSGSASKSGTVAREGAVTKTGTISLTGNSVADVEIGKLITCDFSGYMDDASGTITGTPNALIERPDHVFKHIWTDILSGPSADIDATTFAAAGTFYAAKNYAFALLINKPIQAADLFTKLAMQCRSRFFVSPAGKAKLFVRQLGQPSGHAVIKNEIKRDSMSIQRSATKDLINYFNIHYDLDHDKNNNTAENCRAVKNFSDSASITKYGQKEYAGNAGVFLFDAVSQDAMVQHVGAFFIALLARIRIMPEFAVFLDNMEIEPGDIIDVTHPLDSMAAFRCEVLKLVHVLGSAKRSIIDHIKIIAIESDE